jgi:4-amino-4-deoxy-L-arabinose transferase-like glycosyltransferase
MPVIVKVPVERLPDKRRAIHAVKRRDSDGPASGGLDWQRGDSLTALAVFAGTILYLSPLRDLLIFNGDEGITLESAERILRGQLPYRDFFSFVTPGSYYLMALCFKLFGTSFLVARDVLLFFGGLFAAAAYWLARRSCSRQTALFAVALLTLGCLPARFFVLHNWDSTMFALVAVCCAYKLLDGPSRVFSFLVGCATALTFLAEQSKGAGVLLGLGIAAVALWFPRGRFRLSLGALWAGVGGFAIPLTLTFGYFSWHHATKAMLEGWFWPLRHYSAVNQLPYGALLINDELRSLYSTNSGGVLAFVVYFSAPVFLISTFAILVLASTGFAVALRWRRGPSTALDARVLGGCIYFGVFLSTVATHRPDFYHLLYLTPLFMYLMPSIFEFEHRGKRLFPKNLPVVAGLLLVSFLGYGLVTILPAMAPAGRYESRRGTVKLSYADQVLDYVRKNVPEGTQLYVHPYQPSYSFMTATVNPSHVLFLQSGMNPKSQYVETLRDLSVNRPRYVLLNPDFPGMVSVFWPATPAEALATDPVEDYIMQHYRTCQLLNATPPRKWVTYFMARNDLACPVK